MARYVGNRTNTGGQTLTGVIVLALLLVVMLVALKVWHPAFAYGILSPLGLW